MTSDDEIIADFRRDFRKVLRRSLLAILCVALYIFAASFLCGLVAARGWLVRYGIDGSLCAYAIIFPIMVWVAFSLRKGDRGPRLDLLPERILRKQIDHYQRRWRGVILVLLFLVVAVALGLGRMALHPAAMNGFDAVVVTFFFLYVVVLCAFATVFYPGLKVFDDERMRALRGRAAKAGFIVLLLALGAAFPLILQHPEWTTPALIGVLFAGGAAPALYYVTADWRADRDG